MPANYAANRELLQRKFIVYSQTIHKYKKYKDIHINDRRYYLRCNHAAAWKFYVAPKTGMEHDIVATNVALPETTEPGDLCVWMRLER